MHLRTCNKAIEIVVSNYNFWLVCYQQSGKVKEAAWLKIYSEKGDGHVTGLYLK